MITHLRQHYYYEMTITGTSWEPWNEFRRSGPQSWEVLMGMSWEMIDDDEELEALFQEAMNMAPSSTDGQDTSLSS